MHLLKYDNLQLQHYDFALYRQNNPTVNGDKYDQEFSKFNNPLKYTGHFPSPGYISYVYSSLISHFRPMMDMQMMMLSRPILKGDHSFKIIKRIGKICSTPVFNALYTVCNEFEEIKMMLLTPTKLLNHLSDGFQKMYNGLKKFGNPLPEFFSTDNPRGDKLFLESNLPSLLRDVKHAGASGESIESAVSNQGLDNEQDHLPTLELPTRISKLPANSATAINIICDRILGDVTVDEAGMPQSLYVGFDCEWPVDRSGTRKPVLLIQVAYKDTIFLFQLKDRYLPESLVAFLKSDDIVKLGRTVKGDLTRLRNDYPDRDGQ
jgi:hypothetical protein